MIKRVYVDNSVIGGKHDLEFSEPTEKLFREFKLGLYIPIISNITAKEIQSAPPYILEVYEDLREIAEFIELNEEAVQLSESYLKEGKFSKRMLADTLHIAIATVNKVDIVVSWNFRDIVNLNKIVIYNAVNLKLGYHQIEIRNPKEILHE
ncbi:MAG: PIN domain protein [Ignavibacteriales bacterium]|nr:PIN domain protein [Ignavibacteriales bacterium]